MKNIMLVNFLPTFCAECCKSLETNVSEFHNKVSFYCPDCHLLYQFVPEKELIKAAKSCDGDLPDYV